MNTYRSCTFIATLQATEFGEGQPIAMVGIGQIGADGFPISCNGPFSMALTSCSASNVFG